MRDKTCIGTMLWGNKTNKREAHDMISHALDNGIYLFDTAEAYPAFPYTHSSFGLSESIIGDWIRANGEQGMRISTKMRSPGNPSDLRQSVDGSLQRLGVERIDHYQLHWPNRGTWAFRGNWSYDPTSQQTSEVMDHLQDMLRVLTQLVREGKLKEIGVSNETAWGLTKHNQIADAQGLARLTFIQNEYSLLHRLFDLDLAEACHHERVKLHAWSPLAGGLLSGKYSRHHTPDGSRRAQRYLGTRDNEHVWPAVEAYGDLAKAYGMDLIHLSLAWVAARPFTGRIIVGATDLPQLRHNLAFNSVSIGAELSSAIDETHRRLVQPF